MEAHPNKGSDFANDSVEDEQEFKRKRNTNLIRRACNKRPKIELEQQPGKHCPAFQDAHANPSPFGMEVSFAMRLPLWIKQCLDFQKGSRTSAPSQPCCLAYFWLQPRESSPRSTRNKAKSCYHKLSKQQRERFRQYIESGHAEADSSLRELLHPELHGAPQVKQIRGKFVRTTCTIQDDMCPNRGTFKVCPKQGHQGGSEAKEGQSEDHCVGSVLQDSASSQSVSSENDKDRYSMLRTLGSYHVSWERKRACWRVRWKEDGHQRWKQFPVSRFQACHSTRSKAKAAALEAACAFQRKLVASGRSNYVDGILWAGFGWKVLITHHMEKVYGGFFKPKSAAREDVKAAYALAKQRRDEIMKTIGNEDAHHAMQSECGVKWDACKKCWVAFIMEESRVIALGHAHADRRQQKDIDTAYKKARRLLKIPVWLDSEECWIVPCRKDKDTGLHMRFTPKGCSQHDRAQAYNAAFDCLRGVLWNAADKCWTASKDSNGQSVELGCFTVSTDTPDEHEKARKAALNCLNGVVWKASQGCFVASQVASGHRFVFGKFHPMNSTPQEMKGCQDAAFECLRYISWDPLDDRWHVHWCDKGKQHDRYFYPSGHPNPTVEDIEEARKAAVMYRDSAHASMSLADDPAQANI